MLLATILLWISIFGAVDALVAELESLGARLAAYGALGLAAVLFVDLTAGVSFCSLQ